MEGLIQKAERYIQVLSEKVTHCTWDKGYYLSDEPRLRELEEFFVQEVPKYEDQIIETIGNEESEQNLISLVTLLGWARNRERVVKILTGVLDNVSSHEVHNYAARSLFPMVGLGIAVDPEVFIRLLRHDSLYCKNKALGCLWAMPWNDSLENAIHKNLALIKECAKSEESIVSRPAEFVLGKLKNNV